MSRQVVLVISSSVGSCKVPFAVARGGRTSIYQVNDTVTCHEAVPIILIEESVCGNLQARSEVYEGKRLEPSARYHAHQVIRTNGVDLPN